MKNLKIALVCPYDYSRPGGVQEHIKYLSKNLRKRGHIVKIITPKIKNFKIADKNIIFLGSGIKLSLNKTQAEVSIVLGKAREKIQRLLNMENFDIIHFHEPCIPLISMQILAESNSVNIATFHASMPNTLLGFSIKAAYLPLIKSMIGFFDDLIAVSEIPKNLVQTYTDRQIHIIPNGIDLEVFKSTVKPLKRYINNKVKILFLGRLDKRKGIFYLLKAYKKLKSENKDICLIIGGVGDEFENAVEYVKKKGIKDVEFLGFVKDEDKPKIFASSDIFCSPALYGESQGIVLLEAMATGKPVVAFANPGYKLLLKGTGSLFLAKNRDVNDLVKKLEVLINDYRLRDFMGRWGVNEAKRYSWDIVTKQILDVYMNAIRGKNAYAVTEKENLKQKVNKWIKKLETKVQ